MRSEVFEEDYTVNAGYDNDAATKAGPRHLAFDNLDLLVYAKLSGLV